jgi:hypothetical protein
MTKSKTPDDPFQPDPGDEAVDMRAAQGPIYKPLGPVEQQFGPRIVVTGQGAHVTVTLHGENVRGKEVAYLDGLLQRYEYWRDHYTPLAAR